MNPKNYKVRTVGKFEGLEECLSNIGSSVEGASSDISSSLKEVVDAIGKTNDLIESMKTDCCKVISDKLDTIIEYLTPRYTFTIVPTPDDATVVINGETTSSVTVTEGSEVSWEVSKDGYETQSGTLTLTEDTTLNVDLPVNETEPFTFVYEYSSMRIIQGTEGDPNIEHNTILFAIDGAYDIDINGTRINDIEEDMTFGSEYLNSSGNIVKIYPHEGTTVNHAFNMSADPGYRLVYRISEVISWGDAVFGDVSYLFSGDRMEGSWTYTNLKSVPPLSKGFSKCEDFSYMFFMCTSLESLPENLFANCTNATNFSNCFNSNSSVYHNLTGESAYDIVDINGQSVKIHLYERVNYPDIYTAPTNYSNCYSKQTNLDDYDAVSAAGWA